MSDVALGKWLDKLEALIDLDHVKRTRDLQRRAFAFETVDHLPTMINYPLLSEEWPQFSFAEIFNDLDKMLLHELASVYAGAKLKDDRLYGIRANYGTGIIASMFGCKTVIFEDTLPIALHLDRAHLDKVLKAGMPDLRTGEMGKVLDTAAYFRESLKPYPKLSQCVGSQVFDIQGPFDNASIMWGSDIFLAIYDEPEKIKDLMQIITHTILSTVRELRRVDGQPLEEHDGELNYLGGMCVRNDSSVNLSGEQYIELVKPFDQQLLEPWSGWIHFCGRAYQWWESLLDIPGLKGINPYQGEFYNLYDMYERCRLASVPVVNWTQSLDIRCRECIRTGMSLVAWVDNYDEARRMVENSQLTGCVDNA